MGPGAFGLLSPRLALTATPYAITAGNAAALSGAVVNRRKPEAGSNSQPLFVNHTITNSPPT